MVACAVAAGLVLVLADGHALAQNTAQPPAFITKWGSQGSDKVSNPRLLLSRSHQLYRSGPVLYPALEGELKELGLFAPTRRSAPLRTVGQQGTEASSGRSVEEG